MKLIQRCVLSYEDDKSDKVYILELFSHSDEKCSLIATWGRRTAPRLSSQVKIEEMLAPGCHYEFTRIKHSKMKAGYTSLSETQLARIDIPGYTRKDVNKMGKSCAIASAQTATNDMAKDIVTASETRLII